LSYLLDTNVCIAAMNGRPVAVRERLDEVVAHRGKASISVVSIFELNFGIAKSNRAAANAQKLEIFLTSLNIVSFEQQDARIAADIRAQLERAGQPIGPYDYLIAAQAIRHDLTLVTADAREFSRVAGLRWENWAT
jgi:tRNA(fMet)-specific endonuclease VapC